VLVVTRLDRLARSTRDLLNVIDAVSKRGAGFRSLKDAWADTASAHGRLMLTVLGGLAEFERELIRARTGEDPAVGMYRQFALENEFSQDQFERGLDLVASLRVGEAYAINEAKKAEVRKLGAAATARVDAVTTWLSARAGEHAAPMVRILQMCPVAATIVAFESLIQKFTNQGAGTFSQSGRTPPGRFRDDCWI
jgi:hypothetical protein